MGIAAISLSFTISLSLGYLLLRAFRTLWVDETRHRLFCARDDLFLYAVDNNLLNDEAYKKLRELANTFIRYAHIVSYWRVAALVGAERAFPQSSEGDDALRRAIRSLPERHREQFSQFHSRIALEVFKHLYRSSLLMRVASVCALPFFLLYGNQRQPAQSRVDLIERDALQKCAA